MAARTSDFDLLLLNSIDEALLSLGETARQAIYEYVKNNCQVSKEEIPQNIEVFQQALEKIFGIGAGFIEILIMKNLFGKIGCSLSMGGNKQLEFVKYLDEARKNFNQESTNSS